MKYRLHLRLLQVVVSAVLLLLFMQVASATVIDFSEQYQDYLGESHKYTSYNILLFPMYQVIDNGNNWTISRHGTTVDLPKQFTRNGITFNVNYQFLPDRIIPSIQINNYSQISTFVVKVNSSIWYLPFPWSASQVKSVTDDLIDMGVFKRTTSITVQDSNTTPNNYQVLPKVIGNNIRLYFNPQTYSNVVYPLTLTENTITVNNATTAGFTSANVSFDGVRWTDNGQIAINLRNDSQLNMTGLVGYWSMDENTGTAVHQVNTESGFINTTNQGTWYGNTTLNYSAGRIGNALSFDGVNDYVNAGNDASLNITNEITISAWIKTNVIDGGGSVFSKFAGNSGYELRFESTFTPDQLAFIIADGTTWNVLSDTENTITTESRYFISGTYNGTIMTLYINGVLKTSMASNPPAINAGIAQIGKRGVSAFYWNGSIDEVRIYNRALSASEIAVMYNTSMRTQGNLTILNQSASSGNVINRTRMVYTGQDSINNASIYAKQSGTTVWTLIQPNTTSTTWYNIPDSVRNQTLDFKILMQGNGSNTPFFTSLEYDAGIPSSHAKPDWAIGYYLAGGAAIASALYGAYRRRRMRTNQMIVYSFFGGKP